MWRSRTAAKAIVPPSLTRRSGQCPTGRRGVQVLELLLTIPVLVAVLLAAMEYGMVLIGRSTVTHAAAVGAREAGKGGNITDVVAAVNNVLTANRMAVTAGAGSGTKVILEDGSGGTSEFGDPGMLYTPPSAIDPDEVRVTAWIRFNALKTDGRTQFINAFNAFGFTLNGKEFQVKSLVKKQ